MQGFVINEMYILEINEQCDYIMQYEVGKRCYLRDKHKLNWGINCVMKFKLKKPLNKGN